MLPRGVTKHIPMPFNVIPSEYFNTKEKDITNNTTVLSWVDAGIYHQVRQHRIYQWDATTTIHLTTTNAKTYRIWIEHQVSDKENKEALQRFRKLLATIAYHLSFYK